jgi:Fe2+ transport system protein FeoA
VQKVPDRDAELLRYLTSLALLPGQPVELVRAEPLDGPLTIRIKGRETAISRQLGDQIHVLS